MLGRYFVIIDKHKNKHMPEYEGKNVCSYVLKELFPIHSNAELKYVSKRRIKLINACLPFTA